MEIHPIHTKFKEFIDYLDSLNLNDGDLYEQYAMMKNATKVLDERTEELQGMIVEEMERIGVDKQTFPYGTFSATSRKNWKYTENVENKLLEIKSLKKKEEESGVATFEIKK